MDCEKRGRQSHTERVSCVRAHTTHTTRHTPLASSLNRLLPSFTHDPFPEVVYHTGTPRVVVERRRADATRVTLPHPHEKPGHMREMTASTGVASDPRERSIPTYVFLDHWSRILRLGLAFLGRLRPFLYNPSFFSHGRIECVTRRASTCSDEVKINKT